MSTRTQTWLALGVGALTLGLALIATTQAGLKAWHLHQQISLATSSQNNGNIQNAIPQHYLIEAASHGAAGAALLARLRSSARAAGLSLERAEPRPLDPADPNSVKISAQASGNEKSVAIFLHDLEAKSPALLIERARLSGDESDSNMVSLDILVAARAQYEKSNP